jgi:hypothetical protein
MFFLYGRTTSLIEPPPTNFDSRNDDRGLRFNILLSDAWVASFDRNSEINRLIVSNVSHRIHTPKSDVLSSNPEFWLQVRAKFVVEVDNFVFNVDALVFSLYGSEILVNRKRAVFNEGEYHCSISAQTPGSKGTSSEARFEIGILDLSYAIDWLEEGCPIDERNRSQGRRE